MKIEPKEIYGEYTEAQNFKNSVGTRGIVEQNLINERFYRGDQWYGAAAGSERPLVRHNVVKRIGDFKMSQITAEKRSIKYTADGVAFTEGDKQRLKSYKKDLICGKNIASDKKPGADEINFITDALTNYRRYYADRLGLDAICACALKNAYVSGTGIVYSFWNSELCGGRGDLDCEVLSVDNIFFADPYTKDVENQPYVIISGYYGTDAVIRQAAGFKTSVAEREKIKNDSRDGKVLVLTKLFKDYAPDGSYRIMCTRVTENGVVRAPFDTGLSRYPIAIFAFENSNDIIYGESEITYLIPNQIAINRMITANVWSAMSSGMPIMVVNGDTVTGEITNDPGQIIKVYGTGDDVKNAVNFVSPPDFSGDFCNNINNLINNTLTQSGATAAILGDEIINNASALDSMKNSAVMSLDGLKIRFNEFVKQISLIWADFFINCYRDRNLKITDENGVWYFAFNGERYKSLEISSEISACSKQEITSEQKAEMLLSLYDKQIITKDELLKRFPEDILVEANLLLGDKEEKL